MQLSFQPMTRAAAESMTDWVYSAPYNIYGYHTRNRAEALTYLTAPINRFFAAFDGNELVGFRSFGADGRVAGGDYDGRYLDTGGGLRPDLTGRGLGQSAIAQGLHFGASVFRTTRFRVTIAGFNLRAQTVCRRLGFHVTQQFIRPHDRAEFLVFSIDELPELQRPSPPSP